MNIFYGCIGVAPKASNPRINILKGFDKVDSRAEKAENFCIMQGAARFCNLFIDVDVNRLI